MSQEGKKEILGFIVHNRPFDFHQNSLFQQLISHKFKVILLGGEELLFPPAGEQYLSFLKKIINFIKRNFQLSSYIWPELSPGRMIILLEGGRKNEVAQLQKIQQKIRENFSVGINLSAGTLHSFKNIFFSYSQAHQTFNYSLLTQDAPFFSPNSFILSPALSEESEIMSHFRNNRRELFQKFLLRFLLEKCWPFSSMLKFFLIKKLATFDGEIKKVSFFQKENSLLATRWSKN